MGGDSIVSIQLVSRARKAGLAITPRAVFQHQTVEALAGVAGLIDAAAPVLPDLAIGGLPLTPIMSWLRERGGPIDGFNQSMLLRVPAGLREDDLTAALQAVLDHHDALRLRLTAAAEDGATDRARDREWSLEVAPAGAVLAGSCLRRVDVCDVDEAALRGRLAEEARVGGGQAFAFGRHDGAGGVV